jgi:hypothetical protein
MQTIIAPAFRLNLRLSSGSGKSKHSAHYDGAGMVTTSATTTRTDYQHDDDDGAIAAKLAYTACLAALQTLTTYLRKEVGIQLHVERPEHEKEQNNVLQMLQRAHDYLHQLDPHGTNVTALLLLLGCWQSVYNYTSVSHNISWRQFQRYKHFAGQDGTTTTTGGSSTGLTTTGGEHHHKLQHHHSAHTTTTYNKTNNAATILDQVLQQTIRYAEGCSTCQRQILLLQRKCRDYQQWPQLPPPHQQQPHEQRGQEEEVEVDDDDR